jgi:uncharacterized RDD family membrane protein YckC
MEISEDAIKMIEKRANTILKGIDVPESDKNEIKRELVSNYVEAATVKAQARGASRVEGADVASAFEASSDPEEIASMYMASYVKSLKRAGLLSRLVAYAIDTVIATALTVILASPIIALRVFSSPMGDTRMIRVMVWSEYFYLIIYLNLIVIFIYFVVCEGFRGFTPGKWLLGLKVLRADGKKADYKEAMLRTIPKLFIVAIVADAILMVLYHGKDRQRIFDRIAGTIVIRK